MNKENILIIVTIGIIQGSFLTRKQKNVDPENVNIIKNIE